MPSTSQKVRVGRTFVRRGLERPAGVEVLLRNGVLLAAHWLIFVVTSLSLLLGRISTSRVSLLGSGSAFLRAAAAAVFQSASDRTSSRDSSFAARSWWASTMTLNIVAIEIGALFLRQFVGSLPVFVVERSGQSIGRPETTLFSLSRPRRGRRSSSARTT